MRARWFVSLLSCGALFAVAALSTPARAQGDFYAGKTINFLINSGAGGNTDSMGRLFMRHMAGHIPGHPTMVPRNIVGAGGLVGANYLGEVAHPDGLTIGFFLINGGFAQLIHLPNLKVRYSDFEFIAGIGSPTVSFMRSDVAPGIHSGKDVVKAQNFYAAGYSRQSTHDVRIRLTLDIIGAKYAMITSYRSAGKVFLAFEQNEVQYSSTSLGGYRTKVMPDFVKSGLATIVWQYPRIGANGEMGRDPALPDVPTFQEVYRQVRGSDPSGLPWEAFLQIQRSDALTRAIVAPKGTPPEAVKALRKAVEAAVQSPEFQKQYEKLTGDSPSVVDAQTGEAILKNLGQVPKPVTDFLANYVK